MIRAFKGGWDSALSKLEAVDGAALEEALKDPLEYSPKADCLKVLLVIWNAALIVADIYQRPAVAIPAASKLPHHFGALCFYLFESW